MKHYMLGKRYWSVHRLQSMHILNGTPLAPYVSDQQQPRGGKEVAVKQDRDKRQRQETETRYPFNIIAFKRPPVPEQAASI